MIWVRVRIRALELGLGVSVIDFGVPQSYTDRTKPIFVVLFRIFVLCSYLRKSDSH